MRMRYRLEWLGLSGAKAVVGWLPLGAVRWLAAGVARLAWRVDKRGRRVALANLAMAFPTWDEEKVRTVARESYRTFGRTFLELLWSSRLTREKGSRLWCIEFEDEEATRRAADEGAIFITPHFRNFEWMAIAWGLEGHPMTIIAEDFKNPLLQPVVTRERRRAGHRIIAQRGAMRRLLRHVAAGGQAGLLPDLTTHPRNTAAVIRCFDRPVSVTTLPALLAVRTGKPVIPAICRRNPDGRYRFVAHAPMHFPPDMPEHEAVQRCWDVFEPAIRKDPGGWLWMYKHWRYRPADAEAPDYPFYANVSKTFDKLRRTQVKSD